jgi:DNA polymerase-3 subunit delta
LLIEPKAIAKTNKVLKAAQAMGKRAEVREFAAPNVKKGEVGRWLTERAQLKGGQIQPNAVTLLAAYVGADLRLLDQELDKLLTYVGPGRAVTEADVRRMVSAAAQTNIFEMVDAVGARDSRAALGLLHELLDAGEAPLYLLFMITRQFRILLQLRLLQAANLAPAELASRLGQHPFVVEKGLRQARQFSVVQLEAILRRLLQADLALKSSGANPILELDLLVLSLTRGQPNR